MKTRMADILVKRAGGWQPAGGRTTMEPGRQDA